MNLYIIEADIADKDNTIRGLQKRLADYEGPMVLKENYISQKPVVRDGKGDYIVVFLSRSVSDGLQNFHCSNCGWLVCQFSSKQIYTLIYGSEIPEDTNTVDIMCARCKLIYRIV